MTGSAEDAEELAQEVFLKVVQALPGGGPATHERGWVFAIAHNLVFDAARRAKRRVALAPELPPGSPREPVQPATQSLVAALRQALDALEEPDRDVFVLREVVGLGYDEIATVTGASRESVRSRLHRVRCTLRERLSLGGCR